ncbi:unnamed protein product [Durusdinium trenchii]|uniref:Uncharacterized protein n=2 Tax=Durusdinium trenchii TaxID=1381693 RepID=A0ABP0R8Y0_9DINO
MLLRLLLLLPWAACEVKIPTVEIAKGVQMPVMSIGIGGLERSNASEIVANWINQGGRGIDTARGPSIDTELAKAGIDRKDVFITTKRRVVNPTVKGNALDYIDLLLIHDPIGDCPKAWSILEDYHRQGVLRAIGISNFNASQVDTLMKTAKVTPAVNQIELNVLEYDAEALERSKQLNITVEAYSPVGRSGHSGDIRDNQVIKSIAAKHSVSTYQVALKWILQHDNVITFQSSSAEHQAQDADVFRFQLTDEDMKDAWSGPIHVATLGLKKSYDQQRW